MPTNLRNVLADDPSTRAEALSELFGSIVLQGTVHAATAPAVPFLLRMLDVLDGDDRGHLVCLLAKIAWGKSYLAVHAVGRRLLTPTECGNHPIMITKIAAS